MDQKKNVLQQVVVLICLVGLSHQLNLRMPRSTDDQPFQNGAVATDVPKCSELGRNVLQQSGSAVDAAITSMLCIGLVNPESSGLGGGLSMVVYTGETQTAEALMALEKAPAAAYRTMFPSDNAKKYGVNSSAVPGELLGMWEAHQRYGNLPWADLFAPVIDMAENGFELTKHVPYVLGLDSMQQYTQIRNMYTDADGNLKSEEDTQTDPVLAATLREIAENGPSAFYSRSGRIAQDLIQDIEEEVNRLKESGEIADEDVRITMDDLEDYTVSWQDVESTTFNNGIKMYSTPLTASGPVLQYILSVLDQYNITSDDFSTVDKKLLLYHRYLEATKFGFALRNHLGDNPTDSDVVDALNALRSKDFAMHTSHHINDDTVTYTDRADYDNILDETSEPLGDTSHVSVMTANGDAVSVTTSTGYYFGCRFYSSRTGIFLNNHMNNFFTSSSSPNVIAPGKTYMTTTCPSMLLNPDGTVKMVVGASGGNRIISANVWVILRVLWMDQSIEDAIEERRIYNFRSADRVSYEERFSKSDRFSWPIRKQLESEKNHDVKWSSQYACVQGILTDDQGHMHAHSDTRKGGKAAGY